MAALNKPYREKYICVQRIALVGAIKIVYCLAKQKNSPNYRYEPILKLAVSLVCD